MSQSLKMVQDQLAMFRSGAVTLDEMWDTIDARLVSMRMGDEHAIDRFEDDKAERRVNPRNRITGSDSGTFRALLTN